jgi:acyl phosphate:glycerol-3-phosphate acyltransferase
MPEPAVTAEPYWLYLLPVMGYLLGSVSSAIVIARLMGLQDPRQVGSGNPGATNVLRYGGKKAAILTLIGDVMKGMIPVLITRLLTEDPVILALTALAAFVGHLYPVFHGFKGGKGVATALGVFLAINPWIGCLLAGTWLAVAFLTRYSSLSALAASVLAPTYVAWLLPQKPLLIASVAMSALLIARHHRNIRNLLAGKETKIGK